MSTVRLRGAQMRESGAGPFRMRHPRGNSGTQPEPPTPRGPEPHGLIAADGHAR
jgi:hypothetical protein